MFNRDWRADKRALRVGAVTAVSVVVMLGFAAGATDTASVASGVSGVVQPIIDLGTDE
jgi:hypothetical protein